MSALPDALLSPRTGRLADLLAQIARKTVTLNDLYEFWAQADPQGAGRPDRRAALRDALDELSQAGVVELSRSLDKSQAPYLPTRLTLLHRQPRSVLGGGGVSDTVWRPELAWVYQARLAPQHLPLLKQVNVWLRDHGHEDDHLPLRERSLEIFGHEKVLDQILNTTLFTTDRLTLPLLRTFRTSPPLAGERLGEGPVLLVIENDNTYYSARVVLQGLPTGPEPVGHIAWGVGAGFEASVRSTSTLPGIDRVRYFGDIDAAGLRIPTSASITASREGLPPVLPAVELYRRLLDTGRRQGGQPTVAVGRARELAGWLTDPSLVDEVVHLLVEGTRVPQEALSQTKFRADPGWHDSF